MMVCKTALQANPQIILAWLEKSCILLLLSLRRTIKFRGNKETRRNRTSEYRLPNRNRVLSKKKSFSPGSSEDQVPQVAKSEPTKDATRRTRETQRIVIELGYGEREYAMRTTCTKKEERYVLSLAKLAENITRDANSFYWEERGVKAEFSTQAVLCDPFDAERAANWSI